MADAKNLIICALTIGVLVLGYVYYQSRQNTIEIRLPTVTIDKH